MWLKASADLIPLPVLNLAITNCIGLKRHTSTEKMHISFLSYAGRTLQGTHCRHHNVCSGFGMTLMPMLLHVPTMLLQTDSRGMFFSRSLCLIWAIS